MRLRFWKNPVAVMWRVEGNKEIPIEYDYGRIPKIIDKAIKLIIERENKKHEIQKLLKMTRERRLLLIF